METAPEGVLFQVLGPFEAHVDGRPVPLGAPRHRVLLAALLAAANTVVSTDRLIDIVWGDEPPTTALSTLQKYVYRLRGSLGDRILTRPPGYLLRLEAGEADSSQFESLLANAAALATGGEVDEAICAFDAALALWRGPAWAEFADFDFARVEVARLEGLRATALEDRTEVALAAGRHAEVIGDLEGNVAAYPLRERPRAQLMLALYRAGRHADALRTYDAYRRYLGEEVGLEPSAELAQLADAILLQKPELAWVPPPGARGRAALPSGTVTFLFSDIEGSTRLFRRLGHAYVELLERHRRLVRGAVASAGGFEVNSEGDGLFFAFSSAAAALGASVAAQRAIGDEPWPPGAAVLVRMGLHTGEATPYNGDYIALPVHQAVRVRDAAHGGQVLLSQATVAAIGTMPAECSVLALGAFPLRDFDGAVDLFEARHPLLPATFPPPRVDGRTTSAPPLPPVLATDTEPLVGRTTELEWLDVLWQRAVAGAGVSAVVHGPTGIGKSRLVAEFARRAHAGGATVTVSPPGPDRKGTEPLLAILDDFDGTELNAAADGVFVLAACRQPVAGAPNVRELRGLDSAEVGVLLARKVETVPSELSRAIHSETHGNPGQIHAAARRLRERAAEEQVQRALERVGEATQEARALRDRIAEGVLERERLGALTQDDAMIGVCPYKGLARYEAADAPFFFGRERLVATLVARIAVDRFVGIIGASGSGKSSLVRAGLTPALSAGALPGSEVWPACIFTPGEHPLRSLALSLAPLVDVPAPELARRLDRQPDELGSVLESALRGREGARVVVVVDQFEEVATLCRNQEERERFAGTLVDAVSDPDIRVVLVPVVRADYYGTLTVHPELAELFERSQLLVGAMTDGELRRAITQPARRAGLTVEDGLVDAVCAEAGPEAGALPLVSTAMAETWARRDGTTLTLAAYRDAGGVHGALARLADDVYAGLDEDEQALAQRLFLRLAEPGEGTDDVRRRMPRQEFNAGASGDEVLDAFVGRRLLIADAGSVEVAHEALLREWPRLRTWLEEDRDGRRLHRHVTEAAAAWAAEGRDAGALYRGTRLGAAQDWAASHPDALNPAEREFLDASVDAQHSELQRARRTARRSRSLAGAMAAFLVIALFAGGLALGQRSRAKHQANAARREAVAAEQARTVSDATRLATQARLLPAGQLALLLAVQGRSLNESTTTDGALETILSQGVRPGLQQIVDVGTSFSFCTDASPDGKLLAVGGSDGTVRLFDAMSGRLIRSLAGNLGSTGFDCVRFSADGSRIVGSGSDGAVLVWDVASGRQLGTIHTPPGNTVTIFGADNRIVTSTALSSNGDAVVAAWDITDPGRPAPIGAPYPASLTVPGYPGNTFPPRAFLAPGSDLLAFDHAGQTEVWHISTHTPAYSPLPGGAVGETPDGFTLATMSGGRVLLRDLASGRPLGQPISGFAANGLDSVRFSPDGKRVAIPTGSTVTVVDLPSRHHVGNPIAGDMVRYLNGGRLLVSIGQTIERWRPDATAPAPFATVLEGASTPGAAHWLSSGTVYGLLGVAGGAPKGQVPEWNASSGARVGDLLGRPLPAVPAGFGDDTIVNAGGTLAALTAGDAIELWDIRRHQRVALLPTGQRQPIPTWDPAAPTLATMGAGGTLALWDVSDPAHIRILARITVPGYPAGAVSAPYAHFSPDGRTVAVEAFLSPTISLVSVPDLVVRHTLTARTYSYGAVFSSDSRTVATAQLPLSSDGRVILWDVATGDRRSTLTVPYTELGSAAFANRWLVTVQSSLLRGPSTASQLNLFDAATLQPVGEPILVPGDAGEIEVDRPGGSRLLSSTNAATGNYMVWDLDPADWAKTACSIAGRNLTQSEWKQYLPGRPYQSTCPQWPAGT